MRIFISADMEGIAGVVHHDQTSRNGKDYEQARLLMTHETNAAIKGAVNAGAEEIIVNDSHGTMRNIYVELLSKEAKLISGSPKRYGMMEGIDSNFDAALFIGYHTRKGTQGILNHSYDGRVVASIKINGKEYGELGMNALVAGEYGVPVVFVSGCNLLVEEARSHIKNIRTAQVKRTVNQVTSENLHPETARALIEREVSAALVNYQNFQPYRLKEKEFHFELEFSNTIFSDIADILPIVTKKNPLTVTFITNNYLDGYLIFKSLLMMAESYS